ncbi:MAG: FtsX-like permease family protein, partial [Candidatus Heimdallarchaeaceae archaeon]
YYVRSLSGKTVKEEIFTNLKQIELTLPFGKYEFQVEIGGVYSIPLTALIQKNNTVLPIYINYLERYLQFEIISDIDEPIVGAEITAKLVRSKYIIEHIYTNTSDANGYASLIVPNGTYIIDVSYNEYDTTFDYTTKDTNNIEVILVNRHPQIHVFEPENNSIILGSETVTLNATVSKGYSLYYYLDNNPSTTKEYLLASKNSLAPPQITLSLTQGYHTVTFFAINSQYDGNKSINYAEKTISFILIDTIDPNTLFPSVINGSQLEPSQLLVLNSSLYFTNALEYRWDNEKWRIVTNKSIVSPSSLGIHKLSIKTTVEMNVYTWKFLFVVVNNSDVGGLKDLSEKLILKSGDNLSCWYNNSVTSVFYHWNDKEEYKLNSSNQINIPPLADGHHNFTVSFLLYNGNWVNKTYSFVIDNTAPSIFLNFENGTTIDFSQELYVSSNEELAEVRVAWDNYSFSLLYDNVIPPITTNGWHTLRIIAKDYGGNINETQFIFNVSNTSDIGMDFFLAYEYSDLVNQSYIFLDLFKSETINSVSYTISGPINQEGIYKYPNKIYLLPGSYTLEVTCWDNNGHNRTRQWQFEIANGFNSNVITTETFGNSSFNWIYLPSFDYYLPLSNTSIFFCDGFYTLVFEDSLDNSTGMTTLLIDTQPPSLTLLSPHKGEHELNVSLDIETDAALVYIELDQQLNFNFTDTIFMSFNESGTHTLDFTLTDSYGNVAKTSYTFTVGMEYRSVKFNFTSLNLNVTEPLANLTVSIYTYLNKTISYLTTDENGIINCYMLPGTFELSFSYLSESYSYLLDNEQQDYFHLTVGTSEVTFQIIDEFTMQPIKGEKFVIRNLNGERIIYTSTDNSGITKVSLPVGDYYCQFYRKNGVVLKYIQVYTANQNLTLNIPSLEQLFTISFQYENGTKAYNLQVQMSTNTGINLDTNTGIDAKITFISSNGIANITVILSENYQLTFQRYLISDNNNLVIIIPSNTTSQWQNMPFQPLGGDFAILITLSLNYFDHYLKGSLLLTYTLIYTEVALIVLVVVTNLHTILRNVFVESRRETTILKLIGGSFSYLISTVFTRLAVTAILGGIIGYGIGSLMLRFLAARNQTVFFGHTFSISDDWRIFLICISIVLIASFVSSLLIGYKEYQSQKATLARK